MSKDTVGQRGPLAGEMGRIERRGLLRLSAYSGLLTGVYTLLGQSDSQAIAAVPATTGAATTTGLSAIYEEGTPTVLYVAVGGSNSNNGQTRSGPLPTVGSALAALAGTPGLIEVGPGVITERSSWNAIPAGTVIRGQGKGATKILHGFVGDMGSPGNDVKFENLTIDGQGLTFSGRCFYITAKAGRQKLNDVALVNFDGYCLEFDYDAGSQFRAVGLDACRTNAGTGSGRYAVKISDQQQLSAVPRTFVDFQSQGTCSIDLGGCNDTAIIGSFIADLRFTPNSRGVNITATRILNQASLTIDGHNNSIAASDINPQLTIAPGADAITIGPGSFNRLPVLDNSGNARNNVTHWEIAYTPVLGAGGTPPSLGNGTLTGWYSRAGAQITFNIELVVGSTTFLGTGGLTFTLPVPRTTGTVTSVGTGVCLIGTTNYTAVARVPGNVGYCELIRDNSGSVTHNSPATFTARDSIRFTGTYMR